eukprot:11180649-Prorocentrum_lima.AAC.1
MDAVRQDLNVRAPLNITGTAYNACCFCLVEHFANNRFLFIDHETTIKKQKSQGTLRARQRTLIPDKDLQ